MPIRVAFADDNLLIRQGVATVVAAESELELVSTSGADAGFTGAPRRARWKRARPGSK